MLLQRLLVILIVLYLTSIQPNAKEKITFDTVLKPSESVNMNMVPSVLIQTCF